METINIKEEKQKIFIAMRTGQSFEELAEMQNKALADFARRCCEMQRERCAIYCGTPRERNAAVLQAPLITIIS